MPIKAPPSRRDGLGRVVNQARASLYGYRWVALSVVAGVASVAIWFSDWPLMTGALFLGIVMLLMWLAAALAWAGTVQWRGSVAGTIVSVVATVALFIGLLFCVGVVIAPYRDPAVPSSLPSIPGPWPVPIGLAVLFAGLFLWGGRRSTSR